MTNETDIAMMRRDIKDLQDRLDRKSHEIDEMKELDQKRMRTALVTLGTIVLGMGLYIWRVVVEGKAP